MARRHKVFSGQISDVDLRLMRVFRTVVACGGLSAAQTELGVGRSTISRQISELEMRFGMRLCERGRAGFRLTQSGEQVLSHIDALMTATEDFTTQIAAMGQRRVGRIEIGLMDFSALDTANPILDAIKRCRAALPGLTVNLSVGTPADIESGVREGRFHLGLVPEYRRTPELKFQPLYQERVGLFCGGDHPVTRALSEGKTLKDTEICAHPLVYRGYFESDPLRQRKLRFPKGSTAYQTEAVIALVQSGLYLGFLPLQCQHMLRGESYEILPEVFGYSVPTTAIWRSEQERAAPFADFLPFLL